MLSIVSFCDAKSVASVYCYREGETDRARLQGHEQALCVPSFFFCVHVRSILTSEAIHGPMGENKDLLRWRARMWRHGEQAATQRAIFPELNRARQPNAPDKLASITPCLLEVVQRHPWYVCVQKLQNI